MDDLIYWLKRLDEIADEIKQVSRNEHEIYDNFGGDNMELIELSLLNELERLKKMYVEDYQD